MGSEPANPLLLSFLKGWWDDAKSFNTKGASTYKRAYESMKACPIPFEHPSQAIELNGLGPKLCERLTKLMEQYCADNGLPMPKIPKRRCKKARKRGAAEAGNDDDGGSDAPPPPPNPKRPRKTKEYVPTYRSGGYALLIALHEAREDMLAKEQLIELAQPHADSSFTAPMDPTKHYTAWASMKTLIEKNLVYGRGRPKRYCLTDIGDEIAAATVLGRDPVDNRGGGGVDGSTGAGESSSMIQGQKARKDTVSRRFNSARHSSPPGGVPLKFGGVLPPPDDDDDEDFRRITERVQASNTKLGESSRSGGDLAAQRKRLQELYTRRSLEYGKIPPMSRKIKPSPTIRDIEDLTTSPPPPLRSQALKTLSKSAANIQPVSHTTNARPLAPMSYSPSVNKPLVLTSLPDASTSSVTRHLGHSHFIPAPPGPPTRSQSIQPGSTIFPFFVPEVLQPSTFSIHLLLDNREVRTKHDRDYIANTLSSAGVTPITCSLAVGDILWIARERNEPHREIVLDYIVERKRLDDLIASIKDGRFHDQKFRLTKSGVRNVVYIIEDYSIKGMENGMQEAVETAVGSTQVVNNFFVKRTGKLDDTIRYLVRMTQMLQGLYSKKPLHLIPSNLIETRTYHALLAHLNHTFPTLRFYRTYTDFSAIVSKSGALTLRDVFLKMLMCIRGLSVEKAIEIQKLYPTPRVLVESYEKCYGHTDKCEMLMKALEGKVGRKKIGGALSGKVAEIWGGGGGCMRKMGSS